MIYAVEYEKTLSWSANAWQSASEVFSRDDDDDPIWDEHDAFDASSYAARAAMKAGAA